MNKKFIFQVILLIIIVFACKKGEDDPFFSFRTRTARLTGEWKLESINYTIQYPDYKITHKYDSKIYHITNYYKDDTINIDFNYTEKIKFEKNGKYTLEKTDTNKNIFEGAWFWLAKNKEADLKNKEALILQNYKYTNSDSVLYSFEGFQPNIDEIIVLEKLSNKEMILLIDKQLNNGTAIFYGTIKYKK